MMPVVAQPRRRALQTDGELSHLGAPAADPHIAPIIGTATNPLITALQNSALIGSRPER